MKTARQRNLFRIIHLIGAGAIGIYVYAPFKHVELFTLLMQVVVLPLLTLSGMWLWLADKLKTKMNRLLIVKTQQVVNGKVQPVEKPQR
jgi:hypothetical protein